MHAHALRSLLTACVALLAACAHAPAPPPIAASAPIPGIELLQPRPGLYSAAQPPVDAWSAIAARGIRTVINLRTPAEMQGRDEAAEVRAAGMAYAQLPIDGAQGITAGNARALAALLGAARGDVLVHCHSANRAGGLLAVMAAQQEGMPSAQALELGRKAGMRSTEARVRELLALPPAH